jgi:hypothetical protein
MKTLSRVASEMALHVLAYNLTRLMKITGIQPLIAAIRALSNPDNTCLAGKAPQIRPALKAF